MIIGGGAAGLFCAIEAGKRGRKVVVIERNSQVGRKIIISGGGRCNFTNTQTAAENFVSRNPHFCKSALARYTPEDFVRLVRRNRIEYYEKKLGQLFCRESSKQIVDLLRLECEKVGVRIHTSSSVHSVEVDSGFRLATTLGDIRCESVVVATGGLSFGKIGATDYGYKLARQFGLKIEPTRPSLVPLVFERKSEASSALAGVAVDALVQSGPASFRENILFTHRGLSGPAILQISNYWNRKDPVRINLLPDRDARELFESRRDRKQKAASVLNEHLPARLAHAIAGDVVLNQMPTEEIERLAARINEWNVLFNETEGYDKAEVTLGGVSTSELSSTTMESKKVPGMFFVGEVVDVTGWLGGYNFQWAWSSGFAAGQAV